MVACISSELDEMFSGGKVEKVLQPEKDEIDLIIRANGKSSRLVISASSNFPRICVTSQAKENPLKAMTMCMLLRKHLTSSRVVSVRQCAFERVVRLEFDSGDEMGFRSRYSLYLEIMGRNSNMIFCDKDEKILAAIRTSDLTSSTQRKVIQGFVYELPDKQDKTDTHTVSESDIVRILSEEDENAPAAKTITVRFSGYSMLTAGELVRSVSSDPSARLKECDLSMLANKMKELDERVREKRIAPCLIYRQDESVPFEYSFMDIKQYGDRAYSVGCDTVSEAIDKYFCDRDKSERIRQHVNDISTVLKNARTRLVKKIALQTQDLADCEKAESLRNYGDLIMQELYKIKRGDGSVTAVDYTADGYPEVTVPLDKLLTPSQNAQKYYKEFAKKKTAKLKLTEQIELAKKELEYVESVSDALSRVSSSVEIDEIRDELHKAGYGKGSASLRLREKSKRVRPAELVSPSGYKVYMGKNNLQNDYVTTVVGEKFDYWFHIKNYPGSHVLLVTNGEEPPAEDFTFCAELAAFYSKAGDGANAAVDYTYIKNVKKPAGSHPGYVTYDKYYTAYVKPADHLNKSGN
ncbi:MAG: fibronectin/fibrinogen-binding protein [Ruminococcaceae bacterium]|nr:fibronectin/fibrinogen-binding protein [Oscillospiraceae bacterium]